jgi:hypothetical protein
MLMEVDITGEFSDSTTRITLPAVTARNLGFGERRGEGRGVPERSW